VHGPWGNGSHLGSLGSREAWPTRGGGKTGSWHRTVEEDRHYKMPQKLGDGLATTPSHVYAQSTYHCALCINYRINNHIRNPFSLYYLFQENKSFGSKKPFAFILWCTGSCVEHNNSAIKNMNTSGKKYNTVHSCLTFLWLVEE
jgi:hypothetical protein